MKSFEELWYKFRQTTEQRSQSSVHYECRRCGTTLSEEVEEGQAICPVCDSDEIATIPL